MFSLISLSSANEFIEFSSLLNPYVGETRYRLSLAQSESSVPTLSLEPSSKIKLIYSIDAWTSAFQIFVGVYTSKFPQEAPDLKNLISANENPGVVGAKLGKEIVAGRIVGSFPPPLFFNFRVSPLGVVPKKVPGEFRLIHHLSFPRGASITMTAFRLNTLLFLIVVWMMQLQKKKKLGRGSFLAKTDIKSAFRIIPIRPTDYPLLGIMWQGKYYYDRAMPMGCASSCRTFEMFSTALEWVAKTRCNIPHLIHILDDYLMAGASYEQCCTALRVFFVPVRVFGGANRS
jgi:hypothetical protein